MTQPTTTRTQVYSHKDLEAEFRAAKVARLVAEIDRCVASVGFDPHRDAAEVIDLLGRWSADSWKRLAVSCGKRPPSQTTITHIVNTFKSRAACAEVA